MKKMLFLDDIRNPIDIYKDLNNEDFIIVRSFSEAVEYIIKNDFPDFISFDHDLGFSIEFSESKTGYDFAKFLSDYIIDNNIDISKFKFKVHSANPVGAKNIECLMNNLIKYINEGSLSKN